MRFTCQTSAPHFTTETTWKERNLYRRSCTFSNCWAFHKCDISRTNQLQDVNNLLLSHEELCGSYSFYKYRSMEFEKTHILSHGGGYFGLHCSCCLVLSNIWTSYLENSNLYLSILLDYLNFDEHIFEACHCKIISIFIFDKYN